MYIAIRQNCGDAPKQTRYEVVIYPGGLGQIVGVVCRHTKNPYPYYGGNHQKKYTLLWVYLCDKDTLFMESLPHKGTLTGGTYQHSI